MSMQPLSVVETLQDLVMAVAQLEYQDSSLSIDMYQDYWMISVDAGDEVDDVIVCEGQDLASLLDGVLAEVRHRPKSSWTGDIVARSSEDLAEFMTLLLESRETVFAPPLDVAFVPHSGVEPVDLWEVVLERGGVMVVSPGETALEALALALEHREH